MSVLDQTSHRKPSIVVIGGGIAGLAAATWVQAEAPLARLNLLEASQRLGGLLRTHREDGFTMEYAAENFLAQVPWALGLCRRIGFEDQLRSTDPEHRGALVAQRGRLQPIPPGFAMMAPTRVWPILTCRVLSLQAKLRLAMEPFVAAKRDDTDETIASFARRRMGNEVYERLIEPLAGSIFGADPQQLSLAATLPQFAQMEQKWGSLWRAQQQQRKQARKRQAANKRDSDKNDASKRDPGDPFAAPREGMDALIATFAERLGEAVQLDSPVEHVRRESDGRWLIEVGGPNPRHIHADGVVIATPAFRTANMLRELDPSLADDLLGIDYRDVTLAAVAFRRDQIGHPLNSHGLVVAQSENRQVHSVSFSSIKYPGRAPEGTVLLRASLRTGSDAAQADVTDDQLQGIVVAELADLLGVRGNPVFFHPVRHPRSLPVCRIGHPQRVKQIEQGLAQHSGLALAGAAYRGAGLPHCVRTGEQAAAGIVEQLRQAQMLMQ